jgi:hypothetical protein
VIQHLFTSSQQIYRCLKLAISARASQIFFLLNQVFQESIQEGGKTKGANSFWERSFGKQVGNEGQEQSQTLEDSSESGA